MKQASSTAILNSELDNQGTVAPFEDHVRTAIQNVRRQLAQILGAVGADITQPRGMAKRFGLDKTLAWKLARLVGEDNLAETLDYLPGRAGLDIAIKSLENAGASSYAVSTLRHSLAEFDRMVEIHCGDRETLELMVASMRGDKRDREEADRKRAFQGGRAIWGVQARLQLCAQFIAPNSDRPDKLDVATVSGLLDLRRLRPDTAWAFARFRQFADDGSPLPKDTVEPIDRRSDGSGPPLMRDFSSKPLPQLRSAPGAGGLTAFELAEGPIGNTASVSCLAGWMSRARFSMYRDEHNQFGEHLVGVNTPAELLLFDLYMHRSLTHALDPEIAIHNQLPTERMYPMGGRERGRLKFSEQRIDLGDNPVDVVTPEMPEYNNLTAQVFKRLGRGVEEFHGFRFRMRYPPMPTAVVYRYELPPVPRPLGTTG